MNPARPHFPASNTSEPGSPRPPRNPRRARARYEPQAYEETADGPNLVEIHVTQTFTGNIEGEGAFGYFRR